MLFGVGAAPLFLPFFLLVAHLPLSAALGVTLVVEVFVFSTGLFGFIKRGNVAYRLAAQVLFVAVPAAVVGVLLSTMLPNGASLFVLGWMLVVFAALIIHPEHELLFRREDEPREGRVVSAYGLAHAISLVTSTFGGLFTGLVGSGAGEMNNYAFLKKYRMRGALATGTSVFIVTVLSLVSASAHGFVLFMEGAMFFELATLLAVVVPGAALGAAVGAELTHKVSDSMRERFVAALFLAVGTLVFIAAVSM